MSKTMDIIEELSDLHQNPCGAAGDYAVGTNTHYTNSTNNNYNNNNNNNNSNNNNTAETNYIAIPLAERARTDLAATAAVLCLQNTDQSTDLSQVPTTVGSCLVRFRECCLKFFGKIMGSNTPSEADKYEFYECGGLAKSRSCSQRSIEIIVDGAEGDKSEDIEDVEQGQQGRKARRHRHRPLHRRFISYLRSLFQRNITQSDSELEEFETPVRYRPDSLSALSRTTRFTEDEIKRIYRGFKAECPTGVVKEDTFKIIYSQFFPQGANPTLYAHYVFNTLDQDNSGIVSFEDFVQGLSILSRGSVEEKLRWTFSLYDINGDGFITREEMTDIVTAIYELMGRLPDECPEEEKIKGKVEQIFQKMDTNGDGVVTMEEFLEACRTDDAISRSMSVFDTAF